MLGANGAGKTTTLQAVAGLHPPESGEVLLDGANITGLPAHKMVRKGVVAGARGPARLRPAHGAGEPAAGRLHGRRRREASLDRVFEMFPILAERRDGAAGLLSGGEQQMLAFGRALMSQPRMMLLDEPSMGLAPAVVESVAEQVRSMADSGIGILMVEQNAEVGLEVADEVVVVARGEVGYSGPASTARNHASVLRAFLGEAALANG